MADIKTIAQDAMDIFYKDFKGNTGFFDIDDFIRYAKDAYAAQLDDEYKLQYADLRRQVIQGGLIPMVRFDKTWLQTQVVKIEKEGNRHYAKLEQPIMSFMYDEQTLGIQTIIPVYDGEAKRCADFIRTSVDELWQLKHVPNSPNVYWYFMPEGNGVLEFEKISCSPKELKLLYVASSSCDIINLPDTKAEVIKRRVLGMLVKEEVIDKTNDGNPNKAIQTEANTDQIKQ